MRAGKDRPMVLRDFADRSGVSDISAFVTVLVQSAAFGTSVAQALRVYAAEMRDKRLMRAEEKANTLPTKLTLGTMFFTVPPLLLILIGPSLIETTRALATPGTCIRCPASRAWFAPLEIWRADVGAKCL